MGIASPVSGFQPTCPPIREYASLTASQETTAVPSTPAEAQQALVVNRLSDLSAEQWKSGLAAWLGWLFDGLDMHLYVLVATPFVAQLLGIADSGDRRVGYYSSLIQAAFLVGWALGGGFFGRIADRMGRSRALDADDPRLRPVHRPFLFRPDLVAALRLPLSGRLGHRGRMGRRGVAPV